MQHRQAKTGGHHEYFHYDPWRKIQQMQREMGALFDRRLDNDDDSATLATSDWVPAVDIKEEDDRFLIVADVPTHILNHLNLVTLKISDYYLFTLMRHPADYGPSTLKDYQI